MDTDISADRCSSVFICGSSLPEVVMKSKALIKCASTVIGFSLIAVGASKPDFSGTWVLDKDRSFSNPPGLEQTLTIVQTGDQIKLESKQKTAQGERVINETYSLSITTPGRPSVAARTSTSIRLRTENYGTAWRFDALV